MSTMKAYRLHSYDAPDRHRLDQISIPEPGKGQVLVQISIVGVNPFDWKIRDGHVKEYVPLPLPATLGVDFVGKVVKLGEGASLEIGQRVMSMSTSLGAYAEYIVVDETILGKVPDELSDEQAGTIPIPALTAWQTLQAAGQINAKSTILIQGASGLVGSFAIQFAKAKGAKVIGTASGKNRQYVLDLGADEFIDYQTEKFDDHVKDVDVVLDYILMGDGDMTARSYSILKKGGALISVADPGVTMRAPAEGYRSAFPTIEADAAKLDLFGKQLASGELKAKIAKVYARGEVNEAIDVSKAGGTSGRLLVDFKKE